MKITKSQLFKIIQEEINEVSREEAIASYGKGPAIKTSPFMQSLYNQSVEPLQKEINATNQRIDQLDKKLETLIGMVQLNPAGASQKLRGPEGTYVELKEEKDEHQS